MPTLKSVTTELPDPPYPEDTKANGWKPEIDLDRLYSSDTWTLADDEQRPWLLRIWVEAWRSVPVGSMSKNRTIFARRIGCNPKFLEAHADILLRGWMLHSDERLYHGYICEQVLAMLDTRKNAADRQRKSRQNKKAKKINETSEMSHVTHSESHRSHAQEQEQEQETGKEVVGTAEVEGSADGLGKSDVPGISCDAERKKSVDKSRSTKIAKRTAGAAERVTLPSWEDVSKIIDAVNRRSGRCHGLRNARGEYTADAQLIRQRLGDWSLEDALAVVERKGDEWIGNDRMEKFFRIKTLFSKTGFEQYRAEADKSAYVYGSFMDEMQDTAIEGECVRI